MKNWIILSFVVLSFSFAVQTDNVSDIQVEIESQVNQYRAKNRKSKLEQSECLNKAAQNHADYLVGKNELSHFQSKKETKTPTDRVNLLECTNKIVLENVAYFEFSTLPNAKESSNQLMELWIKSKGHRNNILSAYTGKMGTAVSIDAKNKRVIAVQVFTD